MGRLKGYLKDSGELDNTVFVVMSDNGAEGNRRFRIGGDDWVERTFDHSYDAMGRSGSYVPGSWMGSGKHDRSGFGKRTLQRVVFVHPDRLRD